MDTKGISPNISIELTEWSARKVIIKKGNYVLCLLLRGRM